MVELLTDDMIKTGTRLVSYLDERDVEAEGALWLHFPEHDSWKLVLVQPRLEDVGPKELYARVEKVLQEHEAELPSIDLFDVVLMRPDAPLIRLLRSAVKVGPSQGGVRLKNNVINGTLIEDAYVYRL